MELLVFHKGKKVFAYPLEGTQTTIGRSQENDLILSGDQVSRVHALVKQDNGAYWLEDHSSHGTHVNGSRAEERTLLNHQDRIQILDWELVVSSGDKQQQSKEETRRTQIAELTKSMPEEALYSQVEFEESTGKVKTYFPLLLITDASGKLSRVIMKKKSLVIGKASDCDIVLEDSYISSKHLQVSVTDRGFFVKDLNSTNGTWVNQAKVQEIYLDDGEKLRVGETEILVSLKQDQVEDIKPFQDETFCGIVGQSPKMKVLFSKIQKVAATDMTTLILGETGSGKEMVARAIHDLSSRRQRPYVVINCGAISPNLIESELFGHEKGAFTGAEKQHQGVFEQAAGGTLFLDEVGELPLDLQSKVLRVLEYQTLRRVGSDREIQVDVRVVAATHKNLAAQVQEGKFREDLFYRLYVLPLQIPALRERSQDVSVLAQHFLKSLSGEPKTLTEAALTKLLQHNWPGNVRELKNTILRAMAFCDSQNIDASDIEILNLGAPAATPKILRTPEDAEQETQRILDAVAEAGGDKTKAAEILGMGRSTLFRKIKQLQIQC